ncbi:MAG: hypothetical protein AB7H97_20565 [Pseudobdellovibrionaceae bacterium]
MVAQALYRSIWTSIPILGGVALYARNNTELTRQMLRLQSVSEIIVSKKLEAKIRAMDLSTVERVTVLP